MFHYRLFICAIIDWQDKGKILFSKKQRRAEVDLSDK